MPNCTSINITWNYSINWHKSSSRSIRRTIRRASSAWPKQSTFGKWSNDLKSVQHIRLPSPLLLQLHQFEQRGHQSRKNAPNCCTQSSAIWSFNGPGKGIAFKLQSVLHIQKSSSSDYSFWLGWVKRNPFLRMLNRKSREIHWLIRYVHPSLGHSFGENSLGAKAPPPSVCQRRERIFEVMNPATLFHRKLASDTYASIRIELLFCL